jgi:hypothetical protein
MRVQRAGCRAASRVSAAQICRLSGDGPPTRRVEHPQGPSNGSQGLEGRLGLQKPSERLSAAEWRVLCVRVPLAYGGAESELDALFERYKAIYPGSLRAAKNAAGRLGGITTPPADNSL